MKELKIYLDALGTAIGGLLGWYFGNPDGFFYTLLAFVVVDYLTGVLRAGVEGKLSSAIGFKGLVKKMMIFMMVGMAHTIDMNVLTEANGVIRTAVIFFYISNEGLSIIENAGVLGMPVPKRLKQAIQQLSDESEDSKL